jgi:hypothetical protein
MSPMLIISQRLKFVCLVKNKSINKLFYFLYNPVQKKSLFSFICQYAIIVCFRCIIQIKNKTRWCKDSFSFTKVQILTDTMKHRYLIRSLDGAHVLLFLTIGDQWKSNYCFFFHKMINHNGKGWLLFCSL